MTVPERRRIGWWLYAGAVVAVMVLLAYSFIGILVLGLFGYYATRPICNRLRQRVDSERYAAILTVLIVLLPTLLLLLYTGARIIQELQEYLEGAGATDLAKELGDLGLLPPTQRLQFLAFFSDPIAAFDKVSGSIMANLGLVVEFIHGVLGTFLLMGLSLLLAYGLLSRSDAISGMLAEWWGGEDTTAYVYARAVDSDLESVFFGNFLFVLIMSPLAVVTYWATNLLAPAGVRVPMVVALGFLTGLASLVPIVVGKLVYVPVVGSLALQAGGDGDLPFVGGVLVVYFVVLDLLPQSVLQPYISGRHFDSLLLVFAYVLGPILFGWYGFFLLPILFILAYELVRIVIPELLRGEAMRAHPSGESETTTTYGPASGAVGGSLAPFDGSVTQDTGTEGQRDSTGRRE